MEPEPAHLAVFPLVVPTGRETSFVIEPQRSGDSLPEGDYRCEVHPKVTPASAVMVPAERGSDGRVRFRYAAPAAGERTLWLHFPGGRRHHVGSVYAAPPGLAELLPLRGDFHTHTWHSDGRSSPRELLEAAWARGLDFVTVTDHDNRRGGEEAAATAADLPILVLPGEEVTFDRGHLVAVGARAGVAELRASPGYSRELAELEAEVQGRGEAEGFSRRYAKGLWVARRIRALGGLSILAHPFWVADGEFHLDREVGLRLCLEGEVDAVELLGDVEAEDNLLSIAMYMDLLAKGVSLPVVGNSDTHGLDHTLGRYWTVVFARSRAREAVLEAVRAGRCVACSRWPGGELRIYGALDLVEYAYFLHRASFLRQDTVLLQGEPDRGSSAQDVEDWRLRCLGLAPHAT